MIEFRIAHCAKQNRVGSDTCLARFIRERRTGLPDRNTTDQMLGDIDREFEFFSNSVEYAYGFAGDFRPDAVAGKDYKFHKIYSTSGGDRSRNAIGDKRKQVLIVNVFLSVGEGDKLRVDIAYLAGIEFIAKFTETRKQRMAA